MHLSWRHAPSCPWHWCHTPRYWPAGPGLPPAALLRLGPVDAVVRAEDLTGARVGRGGDERTRGHRPSWPGVVPSSRIAAVRKGTAAQSALVWPLCHHRRAVTLASYCRYGGLPTTDSTCAPARTSRNLAIPLHDGTPRKAIPLSPQGQFLLPRATKRLQFDAHSPQAVGHRIERPESHAPEGVEHDRARAHIALLQQMTIDAVNQAPGELGRMGKGLGDDQVLPTVAVAAVATGVAGTLPMSPAARTATAIYLRPHRPLPG